MVRTTVFTINAHVAVAHFQGHRRDRRPAYATIGFHVVFHAVVQPFWRHVAFTVHVDAVGQGNVYATTDGERHAVIAFFRADVDGFGTRIQHYRAHFQVVACAHAAGLGAVIGVFKPVAFGIQAG